MLHLQEDLLRVLSSSSLILLLQPGHSVLIGQVPSAWSWNTGNISNSPICLVGQIQQKMSRLFLLAPAVGAAKVKSKACQQAKEKALSLCTLPFTLLFLLYSAHFFTTPCIIFSIFCSHQHFLSFPVFLLPNCPFSTTIFISVMSQPSSCNSLMSLQNLYPALKSGTLCVMKASGFTLSLLLAKGLSGSWESL